MSTEENETDDKKRLQALRLKGYQAREQDDFHVALYYFTQALKFDDTNPELLMDRASVLFLMERYEEAATLNEGAVRQLPDQWNAHAALGASYLRMGRYEEAIAEVERAIELNNNYVEPYLDLSFAYSALGRHDKAADVVEAAVRLNLSHPRLDFRRGYIAVSKNDMAQAFDHFCRAEAAAPNDLDFIYAVASAAKKLNKFLIARDAYKRALAIRPDWQDALIGLAYSEGALSNGVAAFAALEKAFENDPVKLKEVLKEKKQMLGTLETPKGSWSLKRRKPPKS